MTFTTPATVTTGGTSASAQFNAALGADVAALASHAALGFVAGDAVSGYLLPSGTNKIVGMVTLYDSPDGMVDLVNQRIVIRQAGTYRVYTSGFANGFVRKNGSGTLLQQNLIPGSTEWAYPFVVNDYIELWYTNGGGPVVTTGYAPDGDGLTIFTLRAEWVAP